MTRIQVIGRLDGPARDGRDVDSIWIVAEVGVDRLRAAPQQCRPAGCVAAGRVSDSYRELRETPPEGAFVPGG